MSSLNIIGGIVFRLLSVGSKMAVFEQSYSERPNPAFEVQIFKSTEISFNTLARIVPDFEFHFYSF
ncbi:MAG: hypothetical protein KGL40_02860 [Rhodocyclaceae bacterium]|nr:hypothetical protein [Rhodocyclaceae bacterium]